MDYNKLALEMHENHQGKIAVAPKVRVENRDDLSTAYTPGVAEPCRRIAANRDDVYRYTAKGNLVAVVSDGTAVLGLGDIGPEAAMPVMEGKALLFKEFADVDAFPLCIRSKDVDTIVNTITLLAGSFGGINLEDISAPRCFEIERRLKEICDIPVFHDDQHGTAIVVAAALLNALKVVGKELGNVRITMNGAGAAGISIAKHLINMGADPKKMLMCDINGILCEGDERMNPAQAAMAAITNAEHKQGTLADALVGADIFVGVSAPNVVTKEMIASMAEGAIAFPMANPTPEIMPDLAKEAGARIVGTGRSDFPNQINNLLAFPGIFRGALDCRASCINEEMKVAASRALASLIPDDEVGEENIIVSALNKSVAPVVAQAVIEAARATGVARI